MFNLNDTNVILTGGLLLAIAWTLRRNFRAQHQSRNRDPLAEARSELSDLEKNQMNRLNQLEVKLYDFGREVEARSEDRLRVLDELLQEADQEINRLRTQLALAQQGPTADSSTSGPDILVYEQERKRLSASAEQRLMMVYLNQAGFSAQEISNCFQCSPQDVEKVLAEDIPRPDSETA
ncbi:hypothetical protein [Gimesia panareensis]|uniref:Uncharacterized protein n=1 Tax=Gimesia panareensis TaxID=2527978 RepID=A0A518A222_9PLAN|nr:hypothetical protein [Gimesia panareensis]QDT25831.1 hypothetical protein Enr10x_11290 [Gimesia panareensis]QDU48770.1 hypothetical protein Pan110_10860 [Gimesia panareensis]